MKKKLTFESLLILLIIPILLTYLYVYIFYNKFGEYEWQNDIYIFGAFLATLYLYLITVVLFKGICTHYQYIDVILIILIVTLTILSFVPIIVGSSELITEGLPFLIAIGLSILIVVGLSIMITIGLSKLIIVNVSSLIVIGLSVLIAVGLSELITIGIITLTFIEFSILFIVRYWITTALGLYKSIFLEISVLIVIGLLVLIAVELPKLIVLGLSSLIAVGFFALIVEDLNNIKDLSSSENIKEDVDKNLKSNKKLSLEDYLSVDYFLTKKMKEEFKAEGKVEGKEEGKAEGKLIERFNLINLIISGVLVLIFAMSLLIKEKNFPIDNHWHILLLYFLIVIRTMSRGLEIIIAFLKDIFEVKKKTTLTPGDRVKLALRSLIEITILFTALYIPYNITEDVITKFLEAFVFSFGISTLTDVNLTFEVLAETESKTDGKLSAFPLMKSLIIVFHVTIALTLIVLSLAQYVGNIGSAKKS